MGFRTRDSSDDLARLVLSSLPDITVLAFDLDYSYTLIEGQSIERHGFVRQHMLGRRAPDVLAGGAWHILGDVYRAALEGEHSVIEINAGDGVTIYQVETGPIERDGVITGGLVISRDITEQRQSEAALLASERDLRLLAEHASDFVSRHAPDGTTLYASPSVRRLFGWAPEQVMAMEPFALFHPDDLAQIRAAHTTLLRECRIQRTICRLQCRDGEYRWVEMVSTAVRNASGAVMEVHSSTRDVTDRKHLEERLQYLADHDDLTGIWNRRRFQQALEEQISRCRRYDEHAALLLVDLDGFKLVNDTHGHGVGDALLREVADALRGRLRETDRVARIGGDEFAVLLLGVDAAEAQRIADELVVVTASAGVALSTGRAQVTTSIGIALLHTGEDDAETAMRRADAAAYLAKSRGRDHARFSEGDVSA